jgi:hypothetical protein
MEDTAKRGQLIARDITVPFFAISAWAILVRVNYYQLRMARWMRCGRMYVKRTKGARKVKVLLLRHILITEKYYLILSKCSVNFRKLLIGKTANLSAFDFRPNEWR